MTVELTSDYLGRNTGFRSGRGLILGLTPEQEAGLERSLQRDHGNYSALGNNCTDPVEEGLGEVGLPLNGDSLLPTGLARNLIDNGLAIGQTAYMGPERSPFALPWTTAVQGSFISGF